MSLYSTIWCDQPPGFGVDVTILNRHINGVHHVFKQIRSLRDGDSIVINGALGAKQCFIDLLFGIYLRMFKKNIGILISDATWYPRTVPEESRAKLLFPAYEWFQKKLLLLCESPRTHYCFLSRDELDVFATESRVERHRVHFTRFCSQLPGDILDELLEISAHAPNSEQPVFAGGNSLRDYGTLIEALKGTPFKAVIASSNTHKFDPDQINFKYLSHHNFFRAMAHSSVTVVPLIPTNKRSVGQQTYLNAMALGKLLVISDVSGVRDHLTPDEHALVVPPNDPKALREAISWALNPVNQKRVEEIAAAGKRHTERMTFPYYCTDLRDLLSKI